jgi:hypothetical protein
MHRSIAALLAFGLACLPMSAADDPTAPKINALEVNSARDEDDPHISSDGLTLFYTVSTDGRSEVWASERKKVSQPWPAGKPVEDVNLKDFDARSAFLTPEGKYPQHIYYASTRTPLKAAQKGGGFDLFFSYKPRQGADWSPPAIIPPVSTEHDEMHPWLMPDGLQLYFSRREKDGWHQLISRKPPDGGQFAAGEDVGLPLHFHHATLTPDGKTMYLQGSLETRDSTVTRWGLFVSSAKGKSWSKPEPLTALNGAQGNTVSPNLSRDGKTLYFASDRPGGKGGLDLYSVKVAGLKKK